MCKKEKMIRVKKVGGGSRVCLEGKRGGGDKVFFIISQIMEYVIMDTTRQK